MIYKILLNYLRDRWSDKEVKNFVKRLDRRLELIVVNPRLFPKTNKRKNVRRSVLTRHTVIYYETGIELVKIVTLFDSRRSPKKLKL